MSKNKLEKEFEFAVTKLNTKASEKLNQANALIEEVVKISEELGVPFQFRGESYVPDTLKSKFGNLDNDHWYNLDCATLWHGIAFSGWQSSANSC
jgi:hypothetical protein